jgi:hypothetical protein
MEFRESVPLGQQRQNPFGIRNEMLTAERLHIVRQRMSVSEHEYRQSLVRVVKYGDHFLSWPRERHALHVELRGALRVACEQSFYRHTVWADKALARMGGIGKTGFQQQKQIAAHGAQSSRGQ